MQSMERKRIAAAALADFDERLWSVNLALFALAGSVAAWIAANGDFDHPRWYANAWNHLYFLAATTVATVVGLALLRGGARRRMQLGFLVSLLLHIGLVAATRHYAVAFSLARSTASDTVLPRERVTLPDYEIHSPDEPLGPTPLERPAETNLQERPVEAPDRQTLPKPQPTQRPEVVPAQTPDVRPPTPLELERETVSSVVKPEQPVELMLERQQARLDRPVEAVPLPQVREARRELERPEMAAAAPRKTATTSAADRPDVTRPAEFTGAAPTTLELSRKTSDGPAPRAPSSESGAIARATRPAAAPPVESVAVPATVSSPSSAAPPSPAASDRATASKGSRAAVPRNYLTELPSSADAGTVSAGDAAGPRRQVTEAAAGPTGAAGSRAPQSVARASIPGAAGLGAFDTSVTAPAPAAPGAEGAGAGLGSPGAVSGPQFTAARRAAGGLPTARPAPGEVSADAGSFPGAALPLTAGMERRGDMPLAGSGDSGSSRGGAGPGRLTAPASGPGGGRSDFAIDNVPVGAPGGSGAAAAMTDRPSGPGSGGSVDRRNAGAGAALLAGPTSGLGSGAASGGPRDAAGLAGAAQVARPAAGDATGAGPGPVAVTMDVGRSGAGREVPSFAPVDAAEGGVGAVPGVGPGSTSRAVAGSGTAPGPAEGQGLGLAKRATGPVGGPALGPVQSGGGDRGPLPGVASSGSPVRVARGDAGPAPLSTSRFLLERAGGRLSIDAQVRDTAVPGLKQRDVTERGAIARQRGGSAGTERAVELGLEFLSRYQFPDGHWSLHEFSPTAARADDFGLGSMQSDTAATGLALLAFLGAGYTHTDGKYRDQVRRGLEWLLAHQRESGDLFRPEDEASNANVWLYSHGIASIALCEAYGMTRDERLRGPAQGALNFIVAAQHPEYGGWRYAPQAGSDTSVSGWQLMALKSGELAGLEVPPGCYEKVSGWLDHAQGPGGTPARYAYRPRSTQAHQRDPSRVMTAEGLLMRMYLGWNREVAALGDGAAYLTTQLPRWESAAPAGERDCYYWYYATQFMFQVQGEPWQRWNARLQPMLLERQEQTGPLAGSWDPLGATPDRWGSHAGRIYVTTLHLLMLEVYYRYLPLYQDFQQ